MDSESGVQSQSSAEHRSEPKKGGIMETEETSESSYKRMKLSDLESSSPSKDINPDCGTLGLNKLLTSAKNEHNKPLDLNLSSKDIPSSINNPLNPFTNYKSSKKSRNDSDCGSSMGPPDEKDPMRVWKGLKQNNFMSTHYGQEGEKKVQKARGKKRNTNDVVKKKIEHVKKEHVDRFTKVAEPSGLLNGLNPGIINHVRNRKQVRSIIESLVKSERTENRILSKTDGREDYALFGKSNCLTSEGTRGESGDGLFENFPSKFNVGNDGLELKLSSCVTVPSENTSCLSIEESGNSKSVTSLSVKAASVASQWLELLNQDIRGRLAALRRSKRRVRAVITTELPDLISREFSSNLERDSQHAARWSTMFAQMDKGLSEEESHLESWLNQVKEMQLHCESGLRNSLCNASQESDATGNFTRLGEVHNDSENDLDVSAAAASIYSTCNFLLTMGDLPCC
ncbi:hypothetical protein OROHE_014224 [Orobanche hederae]